MSNYSFFNDKYKVAKDLIKYINLRYSLQSWEIIINKTSQLLARYVYCYHPESITADNLIRLSCRMLIFNTIREIFLMFWELSLLGEKDHKIIRTSKGITCKLLIYVWESCLELSLFVYLVELFKSHVSRKS